MKSTKAQEKRNNHVIGAIYFTLSMALFGITDAFSKQLSFTIPIAEIVTLRCLLSALMMLPFLGKMQIRKYTKIHLARSVMYVTALLLCTYGVTKVQIVVATIVGFTIPLFTLVFSAILLKEKVRLQRWAAAIIGFCSIYLCSEQKGSIDIHVVALAISACIFALMEVFNKMVVNSSDVPLLDSLFFSSLLSGLMAAPLALIEWVNPNLQEIALSGALGILGNVVIFILMINAYKLTELSSLASYRYLEIIFTTIVGYLWFQEIPSNNIWVAGGIIVFVTAWCTYSEHRSSKNQAKRSLN